jgi:adenylyltransferase/sulfurtransferase
MTAERSPGRYSAQSAVQGIGQKGQDIIRAAHLLLIGLGGLGCAAAQYLAAAGTGRLTLCDFDTVAESNLSRQILYTARDVGSPKTATARDALLRLNPDISLTLVDDRVDDAALARLLPDCDLLLDASDNYGTRLAANRACLAAGVPWVMGSCIRMEGQLILFSGREDEACYRCVYGSAPDTLEDCPGAGVFSPVAGIVGTAMAHLALGHLTESVSAAGMHVLDGSRWQWRAINTTKRSNCPDCGGA